MSLENLRKIFERQGFETLTGLEPFDLIAESERVFVAIEQFSAIEEMIDLWDTVQANLAVEFFGPTGLQEEKIWDTYLILVCPGLAEMDPNTAIKVDDILGNMAYCRKLLLDTNYLAEEELIRQKLSPLFSIRDVGQPQSINPLDSLQQKLRHHGVAESLLSLLDETDLERLIQRAKVGTDE